MAGFGVHRIDADIVAGQRVDARIGDLFGLQAGNFLLLPHLGIHIADADDDMASVRLHAHGLHVDIDRLFPCDQAIGQRKGAVLIQRAQDVLLGKGLDKVIPVLFVDEQLGVFRAGVEEVGAAALDGKTLASLL